MEYSIQIVMHMRERLHYVYIYAILVREFGLSRKKRF